MKTIQFFKPSASKIVITIILLFIPFYRQIICGFIGNCFSVWHSTFALFVEIINSSRLDIGIPMLLISIVIAYVVSSIIIWSFGKLTAKRRKSK